MQFPPLQIVVTLASLMAMSLSSRPSHAAVEEIYGAVDTQAAPAVTSTDPALKASESKPSSDSVSVSSIPLGIVPAYQRATPEWGLGLSTSLNALDGANGLSGAEIKGFSIQLEYQPAVIQRFGVLAFGPSINLYPAIPRSNLTEGWVGIWSAGAQVRYQARYFREQVLVPMVGFDFESIGYRLKSGAEGRFWAKGLMLGGMFFLNVLDRDSAASFYIDNQVARTYLVAELRALEGQDPGVRLSGRSLFFGLRFEF